MSPRYVRYILVGILCAWFICTPATAPAVVAAAPPGAGTPACDPITANTTWTTGNVYVVRDCNLTIASGVTLTLQPGVVVKFWGTAPGYGSGPGSAAVIVDGAISALGTVEQPVVFTSYADDAHGGDTNENGASSGAAGDWYGLVFQTGSSGHLEHFYVGYAGSGVFNAAGIGYGRGQIDARQGAVQLRHGEVTTGKTVGVYLEGAGITPTIEDVHVTANHTSDTRGYAIYQATMNMQPSYAALTFSGNDRNEVTIGNFNGDLGQDVTLGGTNFGFTCGYSLCELYVPTGRTLTVAPGASLDFRVSHGIAVSSGGRLIAEGTADQPITFTSRLAAAGDANQYWLGLWAQLGSTLRLDHCDISYGTDGNYGNGGLEIDADDAQVQNCKIHHNKATGLYVASTNNSTIHPVLTNVDVTDNGQTGVHLEARNGTSLWVTWEGGSISRNGWSGLTSYTSNSVLSPTLWGLTIADNGALGDSVGRRAGIYWNHHNVSPTLENVALTGNVGHAAYWYCNGSITAHNLTATGNEQNELTLPGCDLSGGRQWELGGAGIPARVTGHINVNANALLSIAAGATLRFDKNAYNNPTRLFVDDLAALYALGTADQPVVFTGATPTAGWWEGIEAKNRSDLVLQHCEIGYGDGGGAYASLSIRWGLSGGVPAATVQHCEIHHALEKGVHFDFANYANTPAPLFRYNNLHDNATAAVTNWNAPVLDARDNYWGDPTGPHHATQNPSGAGDDVGDNILFYPWLGAPPSGEEIPGEMLVSTGSSNRFSPGETVDYAVQYLNLSGATVENAVLMVRLPTLAAYVSSSGGVYWPERHQVFWVLGDLPPGSHAFLAFTVKFQWGIPGGQTDNVATLLVGDNYNAGLLDVTPFKTYTPLTAAETGPLTLAEWQAAAAANPDLNTLYTQATAEGFAWGRAERVRLSTDAIATQAILLHAGRHAVRVLSDDAGHPFAATFWAGEYTVEDVTGGVHWNLSTNQRSFFGDWAFLAAAAFVEPAAFGMGPARPTVCLGAGCCLSNCLAKVAITAVAGKLSGAVNKALTAYDCVQALKNPTPENLAKCSGQVKQDMLTVKEVPVMGELIGVTECLAQCSGDPTSNDCGSDLVTCEPSYANLYDWVGVPSKTVHRCVGGCYGATAFQPCAFGDCCMPGVGCVSGGAGGTNCSSAGFVPAKDPNALEGLAGDLLPGQTVTYTISYENEGAGRAYGVYVVNPLPEVFDAGTLTFVNKAGSYVAESREILWLVGELAPKGAAGSKGEITYTVALTGGLASGTVVANQATVVFPSVPEETPTNTWVNLVAPLVAAPQTLSTGYMAPLPVTLSGREISGLPLTYEVDAQPRSGRLSGAAPDLTYTPMENFTGADAFSFRVSNGTSTSRPAQVSITVTPAGDTTPPQVLWTNPEADATDLPVSATAAFTDSIGPAYAPVILAGVSEALDPASVSAATVTLTRSGATIAASAAFNGGANQIVLTPRVALVAGRYTVTLKTGVTDAAGNGLAESYVWSFTVGEPVNGGRIYLPVLINTARS